jgi:hypothetical protein
MIICTEVRHFLLVTSQVHSPPSSCASAATPGVTIRTKMSPLAFGRSSHLLAGSAVAAVDVDVWAGAAELEVWAGAADADGDVAAAELAELRAVTWLHAVSPAAIIRSSDTAASRWEGCVKGLFDSGNDASRTVGHW